MKCVDTGEAGKMPNSALPLTSLFISSQNSDLVPKQSTEDTSEMFCPPSFSLCINLNLWIFKKVFGAFQ